jgi:aminopeptidase S
MQLGSTASGSKAFVTGPAAGSTAGTYDLDGRSTVRTGPITLPASAGQKLAFRWTFAHDAAGSSADSLVALVERADGSTTQVWARRGAATLAKAGWRYVALPLDAWAGETIRIRFVATDGGANNTVEAGIDDVRVTLPG